MVVVNSRRVVESRSEVLMTGVVRAEELASVVVAGASPPFPDVPAVAEGELLLLLLLSSLLLLLLLLPPLVVGVAAGVVFAGGLDVGAFCVVDGSLAVVGSGSGVADVAGGADDAGGASEDSGAGAADEVAGAADGVEAPVPSASCRLPWCRYWLMPSM